MRRCFLALIPLLIGASCQAQHAYSQQQVITYAKSVDAHTLDPTLPSQKLEDWLQSGPPHAHIQWEVSDTCDNHPEPGYDFPLCAKVWFSRNGQAGSLLIQVGTNKKGIDGLPQLYNPILGWEDGGGWIITGEAEHLSGLPALLDQPPYAHVVGQLYDNIISQHPVGIPTAHEAALVRPFLSKRLELQLESAKACEADYFRQHPQTTDRATQPAWLKTDLFTGSGNRIAPTSAWPVRQGQQKDGAFLVLVNLFSQTIDLGNGLKGGAGNPGGSWHAMVRVTSEDGRYVVDDVRLFEGASTEGPSYLLSESFPGCSGPHWEGSPASTR